MSYPTATASTVLSATETFIALLDRNRGMRLRIREVCTDLSIFDWWNDTLSLSQLKAMRSFLKTAIKNGYDGYVCFKVGAKYCASGMWAYKNESTTGYSPDGEALYRSFQASHNYWDACDANNNWLAEQTASFDTFKTSRALFSAMEVDGR